MADHQWEAHCSCGASWWVYALAEPEDVECKACGSTVVDFADCGEMHP